MKRIIFKVRRIFLIALFISLINLCSGQNWPKVFNYDYHVYVENLQEVYDKGYLLCGSQGQNPVVFHFGLLIKTDINGNTLWEKRYSDLDQIIYFTHVENTIDGGAIISGFTSENEAICDPLFLKVNACFEVEWCKVIISPSYAGTYVRVLPDGSFVGSMRYYNIPDQKFRISLIKLDETGEPVWIKWLVQGDSTVDNEEAYQLLVTSDTNFLVSGATGGPIPLFVLADSTGDQEWELKWKEEQYIWGAGYHTVEKDPGIFYSAGTRFCGRSSPAPAIFKFNSAGEQLDDFCLLGDTIYFGWAKPICVYNDTTLLVGIEWENFTYEEAFSEVFMTDTLGIIKSRRLLLEEERTPDDIIQTFDKKILVGGTYATSDSWDIHLFKLNENLEDDTLYPYPLNYDTLCPYQIPSDTIALDCHIFVNINEIPTKEEYESTIKLFPDPARDWITLSFPESLPPVVNNLEVYDVFGREVLKNRVGPGNKTLSLDISNLPDGLYLISCIVSDKRILKGKFVVAR